MRTCKPGEDVSPVEFEAFYPVAFFPVKRQTTSRSAAVIILAGLAERAQEALPLAMRFELDREHRLLFINCEGLAIDSLSDIVEVERMLVELLTPVVTSPAERVAVVVNYDSFTILPTLVDAYSAMVRRLTARFYSRVTRYGSGGFLKARLAAGGAQSAG